MSVRLKDRRFKVSEVGDSMGFGRNGKRVLWKVGEVGKGVCYLVWCVDYISGF